MKRPTRKKLLEAIDGVRKYCVFRPLRMFKAEFVDENGVEQMWDSVDFFNMDDLVSMLMDKSLTHRIVRVRSVDFILTFGSCVVFTLMPDKENRTNIDAEFMEKIMQLEVKPYESGR